MDPTQRLAQLALTYLSRTDLKGGEVGTFVEVNNWLMSIVNPEPAAHAVPHVNGKSSDGVAVS